MLAPLAPAKTPPAKTATPAKTSPPPQRTAQRQAALQAARPLPAARTLAPGAAPHPAAPRVAAHSALAWLPKFVQEEASAYAHDFRGYPLLTVLLGHDPFTGKQVQRTPQALAEGLLAFSDDGQELYRTVQQSGVLPAVAELIQQHAAKHDLSLARVRATLAQSAAGYKEASFLHPIDAFHLVVDPFEQLGLDAFNFAKEVVMPLLELVFSRVAGPKAKEVLALIKRTGQTLRVIMKHPVRFLGYLVEAAKRGFQGFVHKADTYLQKGMAQWILGPLAELNLTLPKHFDAAGILSLSLQVLGLTYPRLRTKMVNKVGETAVSTLEKGAGLVQTLATKGPRAAGQELLAIAADQVAKVRQQVEDGVRNWLAKTLLGRLLTELLKLLTPAGAVLTAIEKTYKTVMFFIDKAQQFQQLLTTIVNALAPIAAGNVGPAATKVELVLGGLVPLALGFVADFIGLGGLTDAVKDQLTKVRTVVDAVIDRLLDKVMALVAKLVKAGKQVAGKVMGWLGFNRKFTVGEERHTFFFEPDQPTTLMVASKKQPYVGFLDSIKALDSSLAQAAQYRAARGLAWRIQNKLQDGQTRKVDVTSEVNALLEQLEPHTIYLMTELAAKSSPTGGGFYKLALGGKNAQGFGTSMTLSFSGPEIRNWKGSKPADSFRTQGEFEFLNQRYQGGRAYYVLGHLLNEHLGGTGKDMSNLTPLYQNTNGSHLHTIENKVKAHAELAKQGNRNLVIYSVLPVYGRALNSPLHTYFTRLGDTDRARIVKAEQYVPVSLKTKLEVWQLADPNDPTSPRTAAPDTPLAEEITHDIQQGPHDYQLDEHIGNSRKKLTLGQQLHQADAAVLEQAGFLPHEAQAIFDAAHLPGAAAGLPYTDAQDVLDRTKALGQRVSYSRLQALLTNGRVAL